MVQPVPAPVVCFVIVATSVAAVDARRFVSICRTLPPLVATARTANRADHAFPPSLLFQARRSHSCRRFSFLSFCAHAHNAPFPSCCIAHTILCNDGRRICSACMLSACLILRTFYLNQQSSVLNLRFPLPTRLLLCIYLS